MHSSPVCLCGLFVLVCDSLSTPHVQYVQLGQLGSYDRQFGPNVGFFRLFNNGSGVGLLADEKTACGPRNGVISDGGVSPGVGEFGG